MNGKGQFYLPLGNFFLSYYFTSVAWQAYVQNGKSLVTNFKGIPPSVVDLGIYLGRNQTKKKRKKAITTTNK